MMLNRVRTAPPYHVPEEVTVLHRRLFVADLHADPQAVLHGNAYPQGQHVYADDAQALKRSSVMA